MNSMTKLSGTVAAILTAVFLFHAGTLAPTSLGDGDSAIGAQMSVDQSADGTAAVPLQCNAQCPAFSGLTYCTFVCGQMAFCSQDIHSLWHCVANND
jgi:hypothetical protein